MTPQAHWSDDDINSLIAFLISKQASAGDGISFKSSIWTEAAMAVNQTPPTKGAPKTSGSCKGKWGKLKETFNIVANIKAQSGFKWDKERGADIDESTAEVWAAYEKKHKGSAPFQNKGWPWYEKVQPLMPNAPRGANVYCPSSGTQPQHEGADTDHDGEEDEDEPYKDWSPMPPPETRTIPAPPVTAAPVQNDAELVRTPAIATKHRHSALSGDGSSLKHLRGSDREPRPSGAVALHGLNDKLDDFTDTFREVFTGKKSGVEATPSRKRQAMKRVQELETTLSNERIVALIDLFQADVSVADAYLSLTVEGVWKAWVHARTKHITEEEKVVEDQSDDIDLDKFYG